MKKEGQTLGGSSSKLGKYVNKDCRTENQLLKVSARVESGILEKIEEEHENRSEGIRKALKKEYGGKSE